MERENYGISKVYINYKFIFLHRNFIVCKRNYGYVPMYLILYTDLINIIPLLLYLLLFPFSFKYSYLRAN